MKKIKALLKSKAGMTFVELLTALALLVIIIASFTPMLLNSYETLYKAGEINEDTYKAKTEIEEVLAGRDSDTISRYQIAFENLTSKMFLNMRKAMENCQNGIQTAFYGGKGTITVVSQSVMPDDEPFKDVTVQFNGINITSVVEGNSSSAAKNGNEYTVAIQIVTPTWGADTASGAEAFDPTKNALDTGKYDATLVVKNSKKYADIKIKDGVDVITTAVKIIAHFYDENGKLDKAEAYVRITPATIMLVGKTSNSSVTTEDSFDANNNNTIEENEKYSTTTPVVSYYTSKGVDKREVAKDILDAEGNVIKTETATVYRFKAFPRELRTANNPAGTRYPVGTDFLSVNYIDNDKDLNLVPYYVLTGTNGVIQRLFISTGNISGITKITGYTENNLRSVEYKDGGLTKKLYPTFWGGDKSHQFGFSTSDGKTSYDFGCWYTGIRDTAKGNPDYDIYANQARMATFFNGYGTGGGGYEEIMRNGRRISYVLLEEGVPLRCVGSRQYDLWNIKPWGGFVSVWESSQMNTVKLISEVDSAKSEWDYNNPVVVRVQRFKTDLENDSWLSYLFLKSYNNLGVSKLFDTDGGDLRSHENATEINITTAFYNPAHQNEDGSYGKMMYLGSSVAYAYLQQTDNTSDDENYAERYQYYGSKRTRPGGAITGYLIKGNVNGGTTIKKATSSNGSWENARAPLVNDPDGTLKTNAAEFYVQRPGSTVTRLECPDVEFTMGYSSNREQVFANIAFGLRKAYDGNTLKDNQLVEQHNSYEEYYNLSHYGDRYRSNGARNDTSDLNNSYVANIVKNRSTYVNNIDNQMYHVWFPGEFYNLTQTATKEGVTVAVGYTVSGSTYQWVNPDQTTNTSTALGSVYNDGVLAVMPSDSESFSNILYYKDTEGFVNNDITGNSNLSSAYNAHTNMKNNSYGTHGRRSVRFTAVDILFLGGTYNHETDEMDQKSIYAIYGDNHGRVFFSMVAQVDYPTVGEPDAPVIGTTKIASRIKSLGSTTDEETDKKTLIDPTYSSMNEFTDTEGNSLSTHFEEISSITVDSRTIYVTGKGKGQSDPKVAICNVDKGLTFTVITLVHHAEIYNINDMVVLGGYLYFAGDVAGNTGFWCAVSTGILDCCVEKGYDSLAKYAQKEVEKYKGIADSAVSSFNPATDITIMPYQDLPTPINSIAGRNT